MSRQALIYGAVTFAAIFMVGWLTGMGGSFLPNLGFSLLMGIFAAVCYSFAVRLGGRK